MGLGFTPLAFVVYLTAGRLILARSPSAVRSWSFALLNVAGFYNFFLHGKAPLYSAWLGGFAVLVVVQYLVLRRFSGGPGAQPWIAFAVPILALVAVRYFPLGLMGTLHPGVGAFLASRPHFDLGTHCVGLSYLAFRSSHLVLEVRNQLVPRPTLAEYVGFCFFAPTALVGPINPYSNYRRGFAREPDSAIPSGSAALRVLVGLVKYSFFGVLLNTITYSGLLKDGHPHPWVDLPIAGIAYYLYLYCNFSGFCDIAIGGAGLMGIPVAENFDNPFAARNVKEFWNRWHMTLSTYMRDVVFSPLSKRLVTWMGPANANHAIGLTVLVVFLLVGIWHGVGWNFLALGFAHAVAVMANHYYTIALKRWLGRDRFLAYNRSPWIRAVATTATFVYVAATLFLFANNTTQMRELLAVIRR